MPSKPSIEFLSVDEVVTIHERLIERFGGPAGVRDLGLLESALFRPQTGYYGDIIEMAAALFESLLMNHPFRSVQRIVELTEITRQRRV